MHSLRIACGLVAAWGVLLSAQTPIPTSTDVAFEVASVRQNKSGERNSSTSGRANAFTATNVTGQELIIYAYRLRQFQLATFGQLQQREQQRQHFPRLRLARQDVLPLSV